MLWCLLLRPLCPQALILIDISVNFRVARFKQGQLVTGRRELALSYLKGLFFVDLISSERGGRGRRGRQGNLSESWGV